MKSKYRIVLSIEEYLCETNYLLNCNYYKIDNVLK